MILQLRLSNSGFNPAMYPSSVVHTGVKFFGCEKRIAQPLPIQSWKLILPWVVSAVKFGASLLIRNDMPPLRIVQTDAVMETPEGGRLRYAPRLLADVTRAHPPSTVDRAGRAGGATIRSGTSSLPLVSGPSSSAATKLRAPTTVPTSMGMPNPS